MRLIETIMETLTPVCPMTWDELNKKGFRNILSGSVYENGNAHSFIKMESFGKTFNAISGTIDEAAELIWQQFCDFINGRTD